MGNKELVMQKENWSDKRRAIFFRNQAFLFCLLLFLMPAWGEEINPPTGNKTPLSGVPWDPESLSGEEKVIYGTDDRIDVYQETNPDRIEWAAATCGLVDSYQLTSNGNGTYNLAAWAYEPLGYPPCPGEPFASQPTAAWCSGFKVADDVIATAGHCIESSDLPYVRFVFGFNMQNASTPVLTFREDQIYRGVEIIARQLIGDYDYAVVRVDRTITVADALPLRRSDVVPLGTKVGVIGHPSGLPKKIAFGDNTVVKTNNAEGFFSSNLDTYGGNSGSPVFNADTGVVEGILVRGNPDFYVNGNCSQSYVLSNTYGYYEEVSKSVTFAEYVYEEVGAPDNDTCEKAQVVNSGGITTGSTVNATGSMVTGCGVYDYADVWFKFHPVASGNYEVSLCDSNFDTTLAIYTGSCTSLTEIACNDDGCGSQSRLCLSLNAANTYYIRVAGAGGVTGDYSLTITAVTDCGSVEGEYEGEVQGEGEVETGEYGVTITSCTAVPSPARPNEMVGLSGLGGMFHGSATDELIKITVGFRDASGHWAGGEPLVVASGVPGTDWQAWSKTAQLAAPADTGTYHVWVRCTPKTDTAGAIADFKNTTPSGSDEIRNDKWETPINIEGDPIEGETSEGESSAEGEALVYGVTLTQCDIDPNPANIAQTVSLNNLTGTYHAGAIGETVTVTIGFRDEQGAWVGGVPAVVRTGAPGTSPKEWSSSTTISVPYDPGTYYIWVRNTATSNDDTAREDFIQSKPVEADELKNDRWDVPLNVEMLCGVTITSCTFSPIPVSPGESITLSGLGGKYHAALLGQTVKVTVGLRDASGAWSGGEPVRVKSGTPGITPISWTGNATLSAPTGTGVYYIWVRNTMTTDDNEAILDFKNATPTSADETFNDKWDTQVLVRTVTIEGETVEGEGEAPVEGEAEGETEIPDEGEDIEGETPPDTTEGETGCCAASKAMSLTPDSIQRRLGDLLLTGIMIMLLAVPVGASRRR